jgi:hypothetical protein
MKTEKINFEEITLRLETSSRGGGIEISLDSLGFEGEKMTAYQNYLGGGLLGRVCSDCTIHHNNKIIELSAAEKLDEIAEQLKQYFHSLTNPDTEWEGKTFEQNQNMPVSAY